MGFNVKQAIFGTSSKPGYVYYVKLLLNKKSYNFRIICEPYWHTIYQLYLYSSQLLSVHETGLNQPCFHLLFMLGASNFLSFTDLTSDTVFSFANWTFEDIDVVTDETPEEN
jgi:hypothetical protein